MTVSAPRRVLVVEDEMMIAIMLEDMLTLLGHKVAGVAPNLGLALAMAASEQFDLAVLDVNLGGGDRSFPVAQVLRERGVPFLFATGYGALGLEAPFQDTMTLQKPFQISDLEAAIKAVLAA